MTHNLIKPVFLFFFISFVQLYAQSFTVSGTVLNEKGQPLIGANVFIDGTALGSATDIEGNYQIKKIPSGKKYTITAMFIGHRTMTKEIIDPDKALIKIDFELVMSLVDLDEVVVAASFSERKKRAQASPVTIISQDELRKMPVRSIDEVLTGNVPGGFASLPSRPGQNNSAFTIRGGTSGSGRPLGDVKIYIDGIELLGFDMQSYPGIADFVDPSDIEKIEVLRGPMGSTLHGSNAQSGIIQIFTKKGSSLNRTKIRMKLASKITEAPILDKNASGREMMFTLSGGNSAKTSYSLGVNKSIDEEVMPSNGSDIDRLKMHGSINTKIGSAVIDLKTYHSWGSQGFISNLFHLLEYKNERSWDNAPSHWDDSLSNGGTEYYKPGFSLNISQSFSKNLYHSLVIGNDSKKFLYKKYYESSEQSYLTENWNRYTLNYFWNYKKPVHEGLKIDFTTGMQQTMSNHLRLSGKLDEVKDQYYYEDFDDASIVDQSNKNSGFYAELVTDFRDRFFVTIGQRIEQNEYFGKDYGTHFSPRLGFSYLFNFGKSILKTRGAWGSGGINPPKAMQALPSESSYSINIGNPDLRPERQSGYEIGADYYYGDNFFIEVTYFDQLFLDGIANDPSIDDLFTIKQEYWYINLGQIINKGIEVAAKTRVFDFFDVSANYTYLDSRWGEDSLRQNDPIYEGFYNKGVQRTDVPSQTGNVSISFNIPGTKYTSKKGGSISFDLSYIGKRKGRDWLMYYDGLYNPDIQPFTYYSSEILMDYDSFYNARFRLNYWLTKEVSTYIDIRNLNNHTDISRSITEPALGRQIIFGFDLDL